MRRTPATEFLKLLDRAEARRALSAPPAVTLGVDVSSKAFAMVGFESASGNAKIRGVGDLVFCEACRLSKGKTDVVESALTLESFLNASLVKNALLNRSLSIAIESSMLGNSIFTTTSKGQLVNGQMIGLTKYLFRKILNARVDYEVPPRSIRKGLVDSKLGSLAKLKREEAKKASIEIVENVLIPDVRSLDLSEDVADAALAALWCSNAHASSELVEDSELYSALALRTKTNRISVSSSTKKAVLAKIREKRFELVTGDVSAANTTDS